MLNVRHFKSRPCDISRMFKTIYEEHCIPNAERLQNVTNFNINFCIILDNLSY